MEGSTGRGVVGGPQGQHLGTAAGAGNGWGWWGKEAKAAVAGVDFLFFFETEFLVLGVVGKGQRRNAGSKISSW
jgi:hypothetical protein